MKRFISMAIPFVVGVILTAVVDRTFFGPAESTAKPANEPVAEEVWTCSMHPQIRMDHKDLCPLCGMDLTPVNARQDPWEAAAPGTRLALDDSAQRMAQRAHDRGVGS